LRALEIGGTPSPLGSIEIIGLARNSLQNTHVKELRYQNLENKGLRRRRFGLSQTVTASTMITQFRFESKVGCHTVVWKTVAERAPALEK
jgi:hypothetical protein